MSSPPLRVVLMGRPNLAAMPDPEALYVVPGNRLLVRDGRECRPSPMRFALVSALLMGRVTAMEELIEALWGDDPDGGPLDAEQAVVTHRVRLSRELAALGIGVETTHGRGLQLVVSASPVQHRQAA